MGTADQPTIQRGDVILIYTDGEPNCYGRIDRVVPEGPGWWRMDFVALAFPMRPIAWILTTEQVDGETFTMKGNQLRIEKLGWMDFPERTLPANVIDLNEARRARAAERT